MTAKKNNSFDINRFTSTKNDTAKGKVKSGGKDAMKKFNAAIKKKK